MNKLKTEPSTRKVVRCPNMTRTRLYCDKCNTCRTLPVPFREVLNLKHTDNNTEAKVRMENFCRKYGRDNSALLRQYENGETILHWLVMYTDLYSTSRNPLLQSWNDYNEMISCLILSLAPDLLYITNNLGETPLCAATKHCTQTPDVIWLLLGRAHESTYNTADDKGNTPLFNLLDIGGLAREVEHVSISNDRDASKHSFMLQFIAQRMILYFTLCSENSDGLNILQFSLKQMSKMTSEIINESEYSKAIYKFYESTIDMLISKGTPICSTSGNHALSYVTTLDLAQQIIDKDITEINKRDPNGCTPLTNVINRDQFEDKSRIINLMMANGAEVENRFDIVNKIIDKTPGFDVNMRDPNGATMLINYAANTEIVNKLLQLGADANITSNQNIDVTTSACRSKNLDVLRSLLESNTSFIPSKYALLAVARNYFISSEHSSEWLEMFTRFISLPNCTGEILINSLPEIVHHGKNYEDKIMEILFTIVRTRNDLIAKATELPEINIYKLDLNVFVNPFTWVLINASLYSWYYQLLKRIHSSNLPILNTPENCITPLTALLLGYAQSSKYDEHKPDDERTLDIATILIDNGVNTNSCVLNISKVQNEHLRTMANHPALPKLNAINVDSPILRENVMFMKNTLRVPDALFIAMNSEQIMLTDMLLATWYGPPMALFILRSWDLTPSVFVTLSGIFAGPLAIIQTNFGTYEAFSSDFMMHRDVRIRNIGDVLAASERIQAVLTSGRAANCAATPRVVRTLRDLSLYTVRMLVAQRAARTGEKLLDLLKQLPVSAHIAKILALK